MKHNQVIQFLQLILCMVWAALGSPAIASSVLIWPVDPTILPDQSVTALWIENKGSQSVVLQVRVFAWQQADGDDQYYQQNQIVASPPMVELPPGRRQYIRLFENDKPSDAGERAWRVIIDQIPTAVASPAESQASLTMQLRYSIPLFTYGKAYQNEQSVITATANAGSSLHWSVTSTDGDSFLEVTNSSAVHVQLKKTRFVDAQRNSVISEGLQGYVLPASTMRWQLPDSAEILDNLEAVVNGASEPVQILKHRSIDQ